MFERCSRFWSTSWDVYVFEKTQNGGALKPVKYIVFWGVHGEAPKKKMNYKETNVFKRVILDFISSETSPFFQVVFERRLQLNSFCVCILSHLKLVIYSGLAPGIKSKHVTYIITYKIILICLFGSQMGDRFQEENVFRMYNNEFFQLLMIFNFLLVPRK